MRLFWPIPTALCLVSAAAYAMCHAAGWRFHVHEVLAAGVIGAICGELSILPLWLARGRGGAAISQAGLAVTIIHLVLMLVLAGSALVTKLAGTPIVFLLWLLPLYWVSLGVLVATILSAIRREPDAGDFRNGPSGSSPDRPSNA